MKSESVFQISCFREERTMFKLLISSGVSDAGKFQEICASPTKCKQANWMKPLAQRLSISSGITEVDAVS